MSSYEYVQCLINMRSFPGSCVTKPRQGLKSQPQIFVLSIKDCTKLLQTLKQVLIGTINTITVGYL